jgi:hypothetical protein
MTVDLCVLWAELAVLVSGDRSESPDDGVSRYALYKTNTVVSLHPEQQGCSDADDRESEPRLW